MGMTLVRDGDLARASRWQCPADSPLWDSTNVVGTHHLVVLARRPVRITQDGHGEVLADRGGAMLYEPGKPYTRSRLHADGDVADVIGFAPEVVDEATRGQGFATTHALLSDGVFLAQRLLFRDLAAGTDDPLRTEEVLLAVLADVVQDDSAPTALVDRARAAMADDLTEPLSLADLGRRVHVSPFHLARTFRAATGSTLHGYREGLRLREAVDRVLAGHALSDVAADLGFASHSHLTARFRARLGITPRELRAS